MGFPFPLLAAILAVLVQDLVVGPGLPSEARLAPLWLAGCCVPGILGILLRIGFERGLARGRLPGAAWRALVLVLPATSLAAFALVLFVGRWDIWVRERLGPPGEFLELLIILAPYLVSEVLVRSAEEGITRRLSRLGYGGLHGFGISRLRDTGFFVCLLAFPLLWDLLRLHPEAEVALDQITLSRWVVIGGFFLLFSYYVPDIFLLVRGAKPLPEGSLRRRLSEVAAALRFRFRDILVWDTGGEVTNAAVIGPLGRRRYVVLTDRLLSSLDEEERDAVFAHEAGHALRHHAIHLLVFFVAVPALLLSALRRIDVITAAQDPPWWAIALFGLFAILALRSLCHRFEIEADLFAAAALGGVESCVYALETLAGQYPHMRHRSSFRHPSLARRIQTLELAAADPSSFRNWRARGVVVLLAGYLSFGALLGLELHRVAVQTPLDLAAFHAFTGRSESAARMLSSGSIGIENEEDEARREFVEVAIDMVRSAAPPGTPRSEILRRLRILAPRKAVRALETGELEEAAAWLELAVSIGGARRDVQLLRRLCLALREEDAESADYYRSYLLELLGEGRLKDTVVALDGRKERR